jgi:lipid-binding SYLF domain-containing protein
MFKLEQEQSEINEQVAPIDDGISTPKNLIEEARKEQAKISIVASSGSHQVSFTSKEGDGVFTKKLLDSLKSGETFYNAVRAVIGKDIGLGSRKQIPLISGESIAEDFLTDKMEGPKTLIHI